MNAGLSGSIRSLTNAPWRASYGDVQSFEGQLLNKSHTPFAHRRPKEENKAAGSKCEYGRNFGEEIVNPFDSHRLLIRLSLSLSETEYDLLLPGHTFDGTLGETSQ